MRIIVASDHGAIELKQRLRAWLEGAGHEVTSFGPEAHESVDYPDVAKEACAAFAKGGSDFGILLCGTGIGISISANKIDGIRCALVHDAFTAAMAREHNDANFIALGGRVDYAQSPESIVEAFMKAKFGGGRHLTRVNKIMDLETLGLRCR